MRPQAEKVTGAVRTRDRQAGNSAVQVAGKWWGWGWGSREAGKGGARSGGAGRALVGAAPRSAQPREMLGCARAGESAAV